MTAMTIAAAEDGVVKGLEGVLACDDGDLVDRRPEW